MPSSKRVSFLPSFITNFINSRHIKACVRKKSTDEKQLVPIRLHYSLDSNTVVVSLLSFIVSMTLWSLTCMCISLTVLSCLMMRELSTHFKCLRVEHTFQLNFSLNRRFQFVQFAKRQFALEYSPKHSTGR